MKRKGFILSKRFLSAMMIFCLLISLWGAGLAATLTGTTTAKVVLRKSSSKSSTALQTLSKGETVTILSESGDWYKVKYCSYSGYIMKQYVKTTSGTSVSTSTMEKIKALGTAPGIMRPGDRNTDVTKLQKALAILGYYTAKVDGSYGEATKNAVAAYQKDHSLTADGLAGIKTIKSIFGSYNTKSLSTQASSASTESETATEGSVTSQIAALGAAPAPMKIGASGSDVKKLQQALKILGYYSGTVDGLYGNATVAAVKKLQTKKGMKADGIAGKATIKVIFGSVGTSAETKTYTTEVLDWFADNVTNVIPKNAKFTVKDVNTGKTFQCRRWSGANHMDTEPLTAADTAVMKAIYGGTWSWNRRAILILYNGHVYAASMNGMPHGTTTIADNNFDGHFCIHFKNSKTHETKKVDAAHQACVTKASKATW